MGMFSKTTATATVTTETPKAIAEHAVSTLMTSNAKLEARKNSAISSFRMAAEELASVNDGLAENASIAAQMRDFFAEHGSNLEKAMADNDAVRKRILDIIGE